MKPILQSTIEDMGGTLVWRGIFGGCKPGQLFSVSVKNYRIVSVSVEGGQQFVRASTIDAQP